MEDVLASMATNRANKQVQTEIATAVLKQQQEQQQIQATALVEMIQSSSLDGTGKLVNRSA